MNTPMKICAVIIFIAAPITSFAEVLPEPHELIKNVQNHYSRMSSYSDKGVAKEYSNDRLQKTITFNTDYYRPTSEYIFKATVLEEFKTLNGLVYEGELGVWGDDKLGRLYREHKGYHEYKNVERAIDVGSTHTAEAAAIIPLFLGLTNNYLTKEKYLMLIKKPDLSVSLEEGDLYLLTINESTKTEHTSRSTDLKLWIDKSTYLIKRYEYLGQWNILDGTSSFPDTSEYHVVIFNDIRINESISAGVFKYEPIPIRRALSKVFSPIFGIIYTGAIILGD
jgi:outer membrane lipoprotein-sorting protein